MVFDSLKVGLLVFHPPDLYVYFKVGMLVFRVDIYMEASRLRY